MVEGRISGQKVIKDHRFADVILAMIYEELAGDVVDYMRVNGQIYGTYSWPIRSYEEIDDVENHICTALHSVSEKIYAELGVPDGGYVGYLKSETRSGKPYHMLAVNRDHILETYRINTDIDKRRHAMWCMQQ